MSTRQINISFLDQEFLCEIIKKESEFIINTPFGEDRFRGYLKDGIFYIFEDGKEVPVYYFLEKDNLYLHYKGKVWELKRKEKRFEEKQKSTKFEGKIYPPMPGNIVKIIVKEGDEVEKGAPLLILESMKMEHTIFSPVKGRISKIYAVSQTVAELTKPLIEIE